MFFVPITLENFENAAFTGHFGFVFEKKYQIIIVALSFSKSSILKMFFLHTNVQGRRFQIHPVWKSVFEELRFRDGLVWTVGLTVEIKVCFQISPA